MSIGPCLCGCTREDVAHAVVAALTRDDLDRAIDAGLLTCSFCPGCSDACTRMLLTARAHRERALAARERFRAREARLARRRRERAERREASPPAAGRPAATPPLPPAAAAALARAKAKAAGRNEG
jgi:hypothetical protein